MSSSEAGPLATYNSLTDKHLCGFFRNARTQRHLRRMGLITKRGEVVSEEMFRISHARREHKKHVRELLAQAIVHKTLDLERTRQIQIRNRLEEMAKKELVQRVKSERSMKGDEDILTLMSPRTSQPRGKSADNKRRRTAPRSERSDENSFMSDDNAQPRAATTASNTRSSRGKYSEGSDGERPISNRSSKSRTNFEIDANGLPVYRKSDEVVDSQYLSRLTPRALRQFTMSLNNIDYMSGVSPYVLPQVEPTPPSRQKSSLAGGSPRHSARAGQGRNRRVGSLHPPHEDVQHPRRLETQVKVTMKYLGFFKHKEKGGKDGGGGEKEKKNDSPYAQGQYQPHPPPRRTAHSLEDEEPAEVMLLQQHCGGNTFRVFKGTLYRNTEFDFFSKRHRGFPFSITLYINGKADSRISTCCEFKHSPKKDKNGFVKLGGKLGRFAYGKAESVNNEGMCYKCRADAKLDEKEKGKTDDDYDEDFQESSNEEEADEESEYKVTVYTGDQAGAGTDANVTLTLEGESGDTGPVTLDRKGKNDFERAKKDTFELKLKEVGKVKKLTVAHDGSGFASAWFLEKIVVEHNEKKTTFYCNKWLSDDIDDKLTQVTLAPGSKPPPASTYLVTVFTGNVANAGTDADVYINITGKNGNSGTKLLDKANKNDFERNSHEEYKIKCPDLGKVESLKIWHDGSGLASAWFLDKVVVAKGDSKTFFYCHDWLADNMDGKSLSRELKPGPSEVEYTLAVHTGDKSGAGTDADVFIQMFGQDGIDSGIQNLNKSGKNDFERATVGEYKVGCPDLGKVEKLKVWHDGSGLGADWYLDKIEVCQPGGSRVVFKCGKWLSDSQDDEKTERILLPAEDDETAEDASEDEQDPPSKEEQKEKEDSERSRSSSTSSFSSDEEQKEEESKPEKEEEPKPEKEDEKPTSENESEAEPDEPSRPEPESTNEPDEDSRPKAENVSSEAKKPSPAETKAEDVDGELEYEVTVHTGDVSGAGTDSDVCIILYGHKGDSGTQKLDASFSDDFERASKGRYSFKFKDLGQLQKLRVWHDGSGIGSGWFLEKIVVTSQSDDVAADGVVFECNKWLDEDKEDGKTERILYPSSAHKDGDSKRDRSSASLREEMGGDDFASPTPPSGEKKHSRSRSNAIGRKRKESVTFQNDPDEPLDEIVRPGSVASIDEPEASRDINRAMSLSSNRSAVSSLSTAEAESAVNIYDPPDTTNESNPLADVQYAPNIIEINDGDSLSESQLKATDSNIVEDDGTASQRMGEDDIMSNSDGDESLAESLTNEKRDDNNLNNSADDENKDNFDRKSVENESDDHKTTQFVDNSPENFVQCTDNDERFIVSMKNVTDPAFDENEPRAKTDDDVISESNERERRESMSASGSIVGKNVKFDPIVNEIENDGNFQQDGSEVADDESDHGNLAAEEESALLKDEKAGDENAEDGETGKEDEELPEQIEIKICLENGTCDSEWVKSEVEKLESIEEEPLRNVCEFSLVKSTIEESRAELCSLIQKITERVDASNTLKVFEFIDCEFVPGNDEQTTELSDKIISLLCLHAGSLETIRMSKLKVGVVQLNRLIGGLASSDPSPNAVPEPPFSPPLNYAGTEDDFASSMVDKTLGRVFNELSSCNVLTRVQLNDVIEDSESCFLLIKALKYMQKIRTLDLSEQDFSDVSLLAALGTVLASLPYLEEVYLKNCRVSHENFMSLQPLLWSPRLQLVDLSGNDLSHISDDEPKKALLSALREKFRVIE